MGYAAETLKLNRFILEGKHMVDIRWWKEKKGKPPEATDHGIQIEQKLVTRLISALYKIHENESHEESRKEAGIEG